MTQPLPIQRLTAPVQTIVPPISENDRIKAYLRSQGNYSELQLNQFLRGYDLVTIAKRQLGIKGE